MNVSVHRSTFWLITTKLLCRLSLEVAIVVVFVLETSLTVVFSLVGEEVRKRLEERAYVSDEGHLVIICLVVAGVSPFWA
jgi:hypothetical protein